MINTSSNKKYLPLSIIRFYLRRTILAVYSCALTTRQFFFKWTKNFKGPRLRVLLYHDIAPHEESSFEVQLKWLSEKWTFITPIQFMDILEGRKLLKEDSVLLTFDDGFISNRRVAEIFLDPMGIKAIFFVVTEFIGIPNNGDWRSFVASKILPGMDINLIKPHQKNMSIDDLIFLKERGHVVGSHTANHCRLSEITADNLEYEIIESADYLGALLGEPIIHFAYTFGDLESISPIVLDIAKNRFKYVYTGLRGLNSVNTPTWAIRRDSISPSDNLSTLKVFMEGGCDWLYIKKLERYQNWSKNAH